MRKFTVTCDVRRGQTLRSGPTPATAPGVGAHRRVRPIDSWCTNGDAHWSFGHLMVITRPFHQGWLLCRQSDRIRALQQGVRRVACSHASLACRGADPASHGGGGFDTCFCSPPGAGKPPGSASSRRSVDDTRGDSLTVYRECA